MNKIHGSSNKIHTFCVLKSVYYSYLLNETPLVFSILGSGAASNSSLRPYNGKLTVESGGGELGSTRTSM